MSLVFFTDRDLGNAFPAVLASGGLRVEKHADHFPPNCPDEVWLQGVGTREWVAITRDTRIRYKPNELAAVVRNRVALLIVVGNAKHVDLAQNFVRTTPRIESFLARYPRPLIAKV